MTYEGFLRIGGVEVVNTERARGYTLTTDCPERWISHESRCDTLREALGDGMYDYANIQDAPWYDPSLADMSGRFYGVVGLDISGVTDSTRAASRTEGVNNGGVIGRTRKAMRGLRVRATIMGRGRDALDYGSQWLSSVFDGNCSQHGDACSTTDAEFLADCPPERGTVQDFTPWVLDATNNFANPSMEAAGAVVSVRRNLIQDPRMTNPTNWGATNATTAFADGGVTLTVTTSATGNMLTATQTSWGTSLSGVAASSSWKVENTGAVPFTVEPRFYDGTVYTTGAAVNLLPGEMRVVKIENKIVAGAYAQPRLWMVSPAVGAKVRVSEPVLEARLIADTFFTGSLAPKVRRNLARNPRAVASGAAGWLSNQSSTNPVVRGATPPVLHPLGIETAAMQSSTGTNNALVTMYNLDGLGGIGAFAPQRTLGAWVLITEPGYSAYGVSLPANEWVFVRSTTISAYNAFTAFYVNKDSGFASTTVRAYITGAQVEEGPAPVGDFFDGALEAPRGFANSWEGVANQSGSFRTDVDFLVAWEGASDASVSLLQGYTVQGITSAACFSIRSSRWSVEGQYSLRLIPTQAGNTSYAIMTGLSNTPERGTAIITRYQEQVITGSLWTAAFGRIYWNPVPQIFSTAALNQPGATQLSIYATTAPGVASTVILPHGGAAGSGDVWYDMAAIIPGVNYAGSAFSGDSLSDDLERYTWAGAVNASASTREVRQQIERPRTDEEYAAVVDSLRRFVHDIAVTSGPLDVEEFEPSRGFYGKTIEFTITSERAWVYGLTKTLTLAPTLPSVVQDTPYNLIPYPSAELTSEIVNWLGAVSADAGTQLTIPTHISPAGGQTTHPSVLDFGDDPFNGYRYWMAHTPYPGGSDAQEDPNVCASNDGSTWVVPAGLVNPLDDQPGSPGAYNSDTELVVHPDGGLLLMWRTYNPATTGGQEQFWMRRSVDGISWTPKALAHQTADTTRRLMSPTLVWENGGWTMWAVDILPSPNRLVRLRSEGSTITPGGWSAPVTCTVSVPAGRDPWHVQVRRIDGQYIGMLNDANLESSGIAGDLYVITSPDGVIWSRGAAVAIPRAGGTGAGHQNLYRASFVRKSTGQLDVWFAGWNTGPVVWNIFRTTLVATVTGQVTVATNYSTNPSVETNATGWVAGVGGAVTAPMIAGGRVVGELSASGTASYRVVFTASGASAAAGEVTITQIVNASAFPAGSRVSIGLWAAEVLMSGSPVRLPIRLEAVWVDGGSAVLRTDVIGDVPVNGGAAAVTGLTIPAGAAGILVRARAQMSSWNAGTVLRLYADALSVTVP